MAIGVGFDDGHDRSISCLPLEQAIVVAKMIEVDPGNGGTRHPLNLAGNVQVVKTFKARSWHGRLAVSARL